MNKLLYLMFVMIFLLDYLSFKLGILSRYATWLPELMSGLVMMVVIARMMSGNRFEMAGRYKFLVGFTLLSLLIGLILNAVPVGAVIYGMRTHLKFLPFFLLPFIYIFTDSQIKKQFMLLIVLLMLQFPLALYQRFIQFGNIRTGDEVRGTLTTSSMLSIMMYCTIAMMIAMYVNKKVKLKTLLITCSMLFIPTAINGTKASFFFLPIALFLPVMFNKGGKKLRGILVLGLVAAIAMPVFISLSDTFQERDFDKGLIDFMTRDGRAEGYLYKGVDVDDKFKHMGKIDSYVLAIKVISEDFVQTLFGVGAGNTNRSFLNSLSGDYAALAARLGASTTTASFLLWETGFIGLLCSLLMIYFLYRDSKYLRTVEGDIGIIALGWSVICVLITIAIFYKNLLDENVISYLFWFYGGHIAATAYRHRRHVRKMSYQA